MISDCLVRGPAHKARQRAEGTVQEQLEVARLPRGQSPRSCNRAGQRLDFLLPPPLNSSGSLCGGGCDEAFELDPPCIGHRGQHEVNKATAVRCRRSVRRAHRKTHHKVLHAARKFCLSFVLWSLLLSAQLRRARLARVRRPLRRAERCWRRQSGRRRPQRDRKDQGYCEHKKRSLCATLTR